MSERLTDAAIREAQARAEKATPGPWKAVNGRGSACVKTVDSRGRAIYINVRAGDSADVSDETVESWHADARFIAAVREDFPRIAAEALARGEEARIWYGPNGPETLASAEEVTARRKAAAEELTALRAEVERLKVRADGCEDSQNEDACGDCVNCARVGMRAALDGRAEALVTVAGLQAEVARLRAELAAIAAKGAT